LLAFVAISFAEKIRFDGNSVLSVNLTSKQEISKFKGIFGADFDNLDIWTENLMVGENHIRCNGSVCDLLRKHFQTKTFISNVQKLIDDEERAQMNVSPNADWFASYHTMAEIHQYVVALASSYPNMVTVIPTIGKSIEKRDIIAFRFSGTTPTASTPRIYFQGGQHAREWIGPATVLYIATQLLIDYQTNQNVRDLLNNIEIVVVPLMNPDGYEFARTSNRMWRKNRRQIPPGFWGVDLNRNWDVYWGQGEGSSPNPSSDVYRGSGPFSEPESASVSSFMKTLPNLIGAIDYHSYSQLILRPYGWQYGNCPDEASLKALGANWAAAIRAMYGISYTNQKSAELYLTDGSASDWFYHVGIYGAFTIELRDTGQYGFILPPAQIIPTGIENYKGFLIFAQTVYDHGKSA